MRKRALAAAAAMLMLAAVVANLLMLSTTAQPIEQDEAVAEKLTQTYVTYMPEPVIRQEEPERDMSAWTETAAYIAKAVYGEAMVCGTTERAAVVWCILNRADDARDATPAGVIAVVTKPYQFHGYAADHPLLPELEELALDVIERWLDEKDGETEVGRVLPREYLFFAGDGNTTTSGRSGTAGKFGTGACKARMRSERMEQLSLFPAALRVGAYIEEHGRRLAWDELQVGMTVIYDCSTESHEWLMVTTVEKIIRTPDDLRVILDGGRKQRPLINRCHIESGRTKLYLEAGA